MLPMSFNVCVYIWVCNHHHQDTEHFRALRKCPTPSLFAISPLHGQPERSRPFILVLAG